MMGYYTRFILTVKPKNDQIVKFFEESEQTSLHNLYDIWAGHFDKITWYGHETDMRELSKKFPNHLFTLYGEGEENGDAWYKHFKNGKMQECRAKTIFDIFDENKMA
jgi:hypothetical protein